MDTLSHALWGYAATRWRGPKTARWGALAGAAPDLLYNGAAIIGTLITDGPAGLAGLSSEDNSVWRKGGPPLPQSLVDIYHTYYVWTHSLIVLGVVVALWYAVRKKQPWPLLAFGLHILMDIPSHERYETPFLFPLSDFTIVGYSWSHPSMLIANFGALIIVYVILYRHYWAKQRPQRVEPWPEAIDGVA